jgi:ribosomal protein S18 acetylase RimI-like enzyme
MIFMYRYENMTAEHYDRAELLWSQTEEIELTAGDSMEHLKKYLERNPGMSFVCVDEEKNKIVGTILSGHDGRRGFIYHRAVEKNHRRKGIADKLISMSVNALRKEGIQRCSLMVKRANREAYSFWEANGWRLRTDLDMFSKDFGGK